GIKIVVVTSFKDTYYIKILPKDQQSNRVIYLSFWAELHYNSIDTHGRKLLFIFLSIISDSRIQTFFLGMY
ncbi:hypothetical protein PHJA_001799400, partial [Phtheirospermum japonicum]